MNAALPPEAAVLAADPRYLLFDIRSAPDAGLDLLFAEVSEATYYQSAFLDHRIQPRPEQFYRLSFNAAQALIGASAQPLPLYIAHTSFCCSTLLARCLQGTDVLALREPRVLGVLANHYRQRQTTPSDKLAITVFHLLAKKFTDGQRVIIKGTNFTNNLLNPLLGWHPQQPVLLMWGSLEDFLISMCKHRAEAGENLLPFLRAFLIDAGYPPAAHEPWMDLTVLQQAVWVWSLQMRYFEQLLRTHPSLRTLSARDFLRQPVASCAAVYQMLDLAVDEAALQQQVAICMGRDAKGAEASTEDYDGARSAIKMRNREAIESALVWARQAVTAPDTELMYTRRLMTV